MENNGALLTVVIGSLAAFISTVNLFVLNGIRKQINLLFERQRETDLRFEHYVRKEDLQRIVRGAVEGVQLRDE